MPKSLTFTEPHSRLLISELEETARAAGFEVAAGPQPVVTCPEDAAGKRQCVIDPSHLVITEASLLNAEELAEAKASLIEDGIFENADWSRDYLDQSFAPEGGTPIRFDDESLSRTAVKYGWAVEQAARISKALEGDVCREVVISAPGTITPAAHLFIGRELKRRGLGDFHLRLAWPGKWEPAVEWIGEPEELAAAIPQHGAIARTFGPWALSFANMEQKFSVLPLLAPLEFVHLHLEGISWVELLRAFAQKEPELFRSLLPVAQERFIFDKPNEEFATSEDDLRNLPQVEDTDLERMFVDDYRGRQMLCFTAKSLLTDAQLGPAIWETWQRHRELHARLVEEQVRKHLAVHRR